MQRLMAHEGMVRGVTAAHDQVQVPQLVCIALLGASLGLGLVHTLARWSNRTETTVSAAHSLPSATESALPAKASQPKATQPTAYVTAQPKVLETATPAAAAQPNAAKLVTPAASVRSASDSRAETPQTKRAPTPLIATVAASPTPPTATGSGKPNKRLALRQLDIGLVVYSRCDGLQRRNQRVPCPRDRKLETHVWETLRALPQCRDADPGFGQAELRLTLHQRAAAEFVLAPAAAGRSLNLRAVSQCAGRGLARLRTRLRTPHAVVTFRFGLS